MADEQTITLTEAELNARVEEAVGKATEELAKKHNKEMYDARQEIKNLKSATKSQEEIKAEQDAEVQRELEELRSFKKSSLISDRLQKEGLPSYFKNDNRLLTASETDIDKVLKTIKGEYEATLPKGNTHSNVVKTTVSTGGTGATEKDIANEKMGIALKEMLNQ